MLGTHYTVRRERPLHGFGTAPLGALGQATNGGNAAMGVIYGTLSLVSSGASAYHGFKRNRDSVGWGIWWGLMGGLFPIITPAIGFAQGWSKPRKKK